LKALSPIHTTRSNGPFERAVQTARSNGCFFSTRSNGPFERPVQTARSNG